MSLSVSEQATLNFYKWESLGRGYYQFDVPVGIEPPYTAFSRKMLHERDSNDDGRVPSLLSHFTSYFTTDSLVESLDEVKGLEPNYLDIEDVPNLSGFCFSFKESTVIKPESFEALINILSYTIYPVSFEIVGCATTIVIQLVCAEAEKEQIVSLFGGYFPNAVMFPTDPFELGFDNSSLIAICDYGYNEEFIRPLKMELSFTIDPLTPIISLLDSLNNDEVAMVQLLFKGSSNPWVNDITHSVSDGSGGSFFNDSPEMVSCANTKVSHPLFSVVVRTATQGTTEQRSTYLTEQLSSAITNATQSQYNKLIPLSN